MHYMVIDRLQVLDVADQHFYENYFDLKPHEDLKEEITKKFPNQHLPQTELKSLLKRCCGNDKPQKIRTVFDISVYIMHFKQL